MPSIRDLMRDEQTLKMNAHVAKFRIPPFQRVKSVAVTTSGTEVLPGQNDKVYIIQGVSLNVENTAGTACNYVLCQWKDYFTGEDFNLVRTITPSVVGNALQYWGGLNVVTHPGAKVIAGVDVAAANANCKLFYSEVLI